MSLSLFLMLHFVSAQENSPEQTDIPKDYPSLTWSMNPLYHSIGLRFGNVLNVRRVRPVLYTYEGSMTLGLGSSPGQVPDRQCEKDQLQALTRRAPDKKSQEAARELVTKRCFLFENPWTFSTLKGAMYKEILEKKERPLLVYYVAYHVAPSHVLMKTRNKVLDVFSPVPNLKIEPYYRIPAWPRLHPEAGVITGRVVQASLEYSVRKSYEVVIQESEYGDNFRAMSVHDGGLFRYITLAMLTGKMLKIEYIRLYNPYARFLSLLLNYMTRYRIISVEIVPS